MNSMQDDLFFLELEILRVVYGSSVEKASDHWNYFLEGQLRLQIGVQAGNPHGEFTLYYEGGAPWVRGGYENGHKLDNWTTYRPDGSIFFRSPHAM